MRMSSDIWANALTSGAIENLKLSTWNKGVAKLKSHIEMFALETNEQKKKTKQNKAKFVLIVQQGIITKHLTEPKAVVAVNALHNTLTESHLPA